MSQGRFKPKLIGFMCNWCCYAGADLCGVSRLQYPPYIRIIRVMCSGRVDMTFIIKSFIYGADGVFIGGCWPADCHYVTEGNYDALTMTLILKKILAFLDINPDRLRLEWVSASEGNRFQEIMIDFSNTIMKLGPLGGDGIGQEEIKFKLGVLLKLVPYIRLVEREKFRVESRSETDIVAFFNSQQTERLFKELIYEKLILSLLLEEIRDPGLPQDERPFVSRIETREGKRVDRSRLAERLGLSPSEVSNYLNLAMRLGLILHEELFRARDGR